MTVGRTLREPGFAPPVYVALDVPEADDARRIVALLGGDATHYKVGLELYLAAGGAFVEELAGLGKSVFLDLKFCDIPNTVAAAVRQAARLGADLLTVHATGGGEMLRAAVEAAGEVRTSAGVLVVTALTSLGAGDLAEMGFASASVAEHVLRLAGMAQQAGAHGVVCSAHESAALRSAFPALARLVPGIRPQGASAGDQVRMATPEDAVQAGADYLVVGRPVTRAPDPLFALRALQDDVAAAAAKKLTEGSDDE